MVVFVDLSKAFDYAVREVVMGWTDRDVTESPENKAALLTRLGLPSEAAAEITSWIERTGGLLKEKGAPSAIVAMVNSLHDGAWFRLPGDRSYISTIAGGRQGCKLGALIFNLIYSLALHDFRQEARRQGLVLNIKVKDSPFWGQGSEDLYWSTDRAPEDKNADSECFEVTYVDDEAAFWACKSAASLTKYAPMFMNILVASYKRFGFNINWDKGKTEAFISLRGKQAATQKCSIYRAGSSLKLPPECGHDLRVVQSYKHLGSILESTGSSGPDAAHRATSAMSAFAPLSKKVFGCPSIDRKVRMDLFMSLVVSRLIYNVHVWSDLTAASYATLNSTYMRGLRRIAAACRFSSAPNQPTDSDVRRLLGAPSLQCIIVQRRLMLASSIAMHGPRPLQAILSVRTNGQVIPWVRALRTDLAALTTYHAPKLDELGPPQDNPHSWAALMTSYPKEWRELVKSYKVTDMPFDIMKDRPSLQRPSVIAADLSRMHICPHCEGDAALFGSANALHAHMRRSHGLRNWYASYAPPSGVCPVCLIQFDLHGNLVRHLAGKSFKGGKTICCRDVVKAGLVKPLSVETLKEAAALRAQQHRDARRVGRSAPLAAIHAQRLRGTIFPRHLRPHGPWPQPAPDENDGVLAADVPGPQFDWFAVRPKKKLRVKTSPETIVAQAIADMPDSADHIYPEKSVIQHSTHNAERSMKTGSTSPHSTHPTERPTKKKPRIVSGTHPSEPEQSQPNALSYYENLAMTRSQEKRPRDPSPERRSKVPKYE